MRLGATAAILSVFIVTPALLGNTATPTASEKEEAPKPFRSGPNHVCRGETEWRCSNDFGWAAGTYTHIACHVSETDQQIADGICGGAHGYIVDLKRNASGGNCGYDWWDVYCP